MTTERATVDTGLCGYPSPRTGKPCENKISEEDESCARHNDAAIADRRRRQDVFLEEFDGTYGDTLAAACRAGISTSLLYRWKVHDAPFAARWDAARATNADAYERVLAERFFDGVDKPVIHQGQITDTYKEFDNSIGVFMLKALRPEKYRERVDVRHGLERGGSELPVRELVSDPAALEVLAGVLDDIEIVDAEIVDG